ncbi:ParB/RepB/Spo0J family partition protein, partial [Patescibacteria group bacterium]|nr:ParB/RepB/Spo0J family partition protein [Patescibacteria group bacterium]
MAKKAKTNVKEKIKENSSARVLKIPILDIFLNPKQPRRTFDSESLKSLADSIKQYGVLQPLVVTKVEGGYELIAGERRLRASRIAGLTEVPAIIQENDYDDQRKLELALIENIQREDLNDIDQAEAYKELMESFGLSQEDIAQKIGISRSAVANKIRLLKLPEEIIADIRSGVIDSGHAKLLLSLENTELQLNMWRKIKEQGLTVRELDSVVKKARPDKKWRSLNNIKDNETKEQEDKLKDIFSTRVSIVKRGNGAKVVFNFYSKDDFDNFMKRIEDFDYMN